MAYRKLAVGDWQVIGCHVLFNHQRLPTLVNQMLSAPDCLIICWFNKVKHVVYICTRLPSYIKLYMFKQAIKVAVVTQLYTRLYSHNTRLHLYQVQQLYRTRLLSTRPPQVFLVETPLGLHRPWLVDEQLSSNCSNSPAATTSA